MAKKRGFFKAGAITLILASVLMGATACSLGNEMVDSVNDKVENSIKLVAKEDNLDVKNFQLIGVDVDKVGFEFGVSFNGVLSYTDTDSKAFATANYIASSDYFVNLNKRSSEEEVFTVFNKIVDELEMVSYQVTPVEDLINVNNSLIYNTPSPFKDYKIKEGLVYNVSKPEFNDEEKSVSLNIKSLVNLKKHKTDMKPVAGFGFSLDGCWGFGIGIGFIVTEKEGDFTLTDNYKIKCDEATYEKIKNGEIKALDYLAEVIDNKKENILEVSRQQIVDVVYDNGTLLDQYNINKLDDGICQN